MAETVFTAVINKAVEISSNALFNEVPSDSSLRESIRWIETEMRRMRSYLADAEAKQISSHGGANLINDIEQLAEDVEIVLYTYLSEIASHREGECRLQCLKEAARIFSCHGHTAHKLVARVEEIKRKVADIDLARVRYNITDSSSNNKDEIFSTSDQRRSFLHVDESEIIGLEKDCKELEKKLLDTNLEHDVISIIGMGGLGKTTLAKRVYNKVKCHFDCSALVSVFQEPRSKEVLLELAKQVFLGLAKQVGLGKDKMEQNLENNLYTFLKEKRYVIFLDDVWSIKTWEALSSSFPTFDNSKNGSRIIITSRKRDIGMYIGGVSSIHDLQPLKPEDSWELFIKVLLRASKDNKSGIPTNLEGIGRELMKRCGGVPLAIVLTASLLRAKENSEHDWNRVLKNTHQNHEQDLDQCSKILGLSYEDLPASLRPCFLYFALFPEDYEIPVFNLINMWAAEKFITRREECEIEEVGESYLNDLVARNLIQVSKRRYDGKIKTCRIHNVLHDLCIKVAKGKKFFHSLNDIVGTTSSSCCVEGPRRLAVHQRDVDKYLSCHLETPKICAFLSFEPIEVPKNQMVKNIFPNVGFLRVLNLEISTSPNKSQKKISTSPNKYGWSVIGPIGKLIHLSYLRLRGFSHTCLPSSISNLKNLLTLDVRGCNSIRLPTCIWKMEQLRHLQIGALSLFVRFCVGYWGFEESDIVTKHYPIEVNLPNIQTLETMDVCYWNPKWLCKVGPNIRRLAVSGGSRETINVLNNQNNVIFEKLENLRLSNDTTHVISSGNFTLSGYPNLLKVHLDVFFSPSKLPSSEHFPPNLIKLTLLKNRLTEDPLQTLNQLPKLKILKLDFDCYIGKTMDCDGGFCQLEVLRIRGLDNLKELMMDGVGMPRLRKVMIDQCEQLKSIPESLQNLRTT
ncbi:toMV resistance protein Tm-2(GCR236)-like [Lycium barbarum]|uniref:toMV resistance protein Tm-2(GCR236)-like n=1 Tax=Lycium barbarum TaxID=112863 RepID=UPI00293F65B6|nr:toMV resistance protein Tm-2(GCR236)-like [Lycium barbarum]